MRKKKRYAYLEHVNVILHGNFTGVIQDLEMKSSWIGADPWFSFKD